MVSTTLNANVVTRFRKFFTTRDFIFHDGRDLKRFSVAGRTQAILAGVAAVTVTFSAYGVSQAAFGAVVASGIAGEASTPEAKLAKMRAEVAQMEADVAAVKQAAQLHAARVEQRQKIDLPSGSPLDSALQRMRTAREQEATTIRANGQKDAQIIRAEADARAAQIYATSFNKDPQFYDFWRAMQSYRTTFIGDPRQKQGETSIILSPDNDYLREFRGRSR